jgi:hypothetical protein
MVLALSPSVVRTYNRMAAMQATCMCSMQIECTGITNATGTCEFVCRCFEKPLGADASSTLSEMQEHMSGVFGELEFSLARALDARYAHAHRSTSNEPWMHAAGADEKKRKRNVT